MPPVLGVDNGPGGIGVKGQADAADGDGVQGTSAAGFGIEGNSPGGIVGVLGWSYDGDGVFGASYSNGRSGVMGENLDSVGVRGSSLNVGVYAFNYGFRGGPRTEAYLGARSAAGDFNGDVWVHGSLHKSDGKFTIDHPLDPANKYLSHSLVESSEMKNFYDGETTMDAHGEATVEFPEWFESLNKDFRYQITAIGVPGPNLHIKEEVARGRMMIGGGSPGMKVCWQVTGVRKDRWAAAHPLEIEKEKADEERGRYLHPTLYNEPEEKSVISARYPDLATTRQKSDHELSIAEGFVQHRETHPR